LISWRKGLGVLAVSGVAALALTATTTARADTAPPAHTTAAQPAAVRPALASAIHGDYSAAIRASDGSLDIASTVSRLSGAHVNTYWYVVCHFAPFSQVEWDQLPDFLTAAQTAGITVWVYLCPPSEGHSSSSTTTPDLPPYQWDYVSWAQHIADLSLTHPNLVGYTMDDFASNGAGSAWPVHFTPAYTQQMVSAGKAVNPNLLFYPIEYYSNMVGTGAVVYQYRSIVDGVIFPYRNDSNGKDTTNSTNMTAESEATYQTVGCPDGNGCYQVTFPASTKSTADWYRGVQQTVAISPASSYTLRFTYSDDYLAATTYGYHFAEVTVNGTVAFSEDIAGNRGERNFTVDLTSYLTGKTSATIGVRVHDKKAVSNFHAAVTFDNLRATGFTLVNPSFETSTGWAAVANNSTFSGGYVHNLPKVDMIYASRLSSETAPPTAAYVGDATSRALALTHGSYPYNIGTVEYALNLTGADISGSSYAACYDTVASIYGAES
jgi:hypothetical protein